MMKRQYMCGLVSIFKITANVLQLYLVAEFEKENFK